MSDLHKINITSPDGRGILTTVTVDGEPLRGVTFVSFAAGVDKNVEVTLRLYADIEFEGEAEIIREWRRAREAEAVDLTARMAALGFA